MLCLARKSNRKVFRLIFRSIKCLRVLESDGIVTRTEFSPTPPRVEYSLTDSAKALVPILHGLYAWVEDHVARRRNAHNGACRP